MGERGSVRALEPDDEALDVRLARGTGSSRCRYRRYCGRLCQWDNLRVRESIRSAYSVDEEGAPSQFSLLGSTGGARTHR